MVVVPDLREGSPGKQVFPREAFPHDFSVTIAATSGAAAAGMTTTPSSSPTMRSPGSMRTPPQSAGTPKASTSARPRVSSGEKPRVNSGKPSSRICRAD